MELKDLRLTLSLFKRFDKALRERYYRNYIKAKYGNEIAKDFSDGFYDFLAEHGVKEETIKRLRKNFVKDAFETEIKPYNDYVFSFLVATQIDDCEICFARMKKLSKEERPYISCWIERRNLILDMTTGSVYDNDKNKDDFYKIFGITKSEIVKISNKKIMNNEKISSELVSKLIEADEENKRIYNKTLKQIKEKENGEGK